MTLRVRAPATVANLGPGFDTAAVALDLWNELELGPRNGPVDQTNLVVRAFATFATPTAWSFRFVERIPRERGLGSSASAIALGLVAGALAAGVDPKGDDLLAAGLKFERHADNLAAALAGGVCLTWDGRIARVADDLPVSVVVVIAESRVVTDDARELLPSAVSHDDAAYSAARAALLGAALASGDSSLLAASADDRLHEPYRAINAPHLAAIRADLPRGALGATLAGSGPSVLVWVARGHEAHVAGELASRFPNDDVRRLAVTALGAGQL